MAEENRHEDRYKVSVDAKLSSEAGGAHEVRLTNLSASGCRFDGPTSLQEDAALTIAVGRLASIAARVVWRDGHTHGIGFDKPLDPVALDHVRLFLSKQPALVSERMEGTLDE